MTHFELMQLLAFALHVSKPHTHWLNMAHPDS